MPSDHAAASASIDATQPVSQPLQPQLRVRPRDWQTKALDAWLPARRGVARVVTGGGKTVFAFLCMERFLHDTPDGQIAIVVPTKALLDQWFVSLQEDFDVRSDQIACFSGDEHPARPGRINVLVVNTARDRTADLSLLAPTFLIVDECHHVGSPSNSRVLRGRYPATLGLSATPEREYDDAFDEAIAPVLGEIIYEYSYADAYRDHAITPFDLVNVSVQLTPEEAKRYTNLTRAIARLATNEHRTQSTEDRLRRLLLQRSSVAAKAAMRIPVAARLADQHRGQRAIVFHERVPEAARLHEILAARGHRVASYHTGISPVQRRDNLRLYRRGVFDILITCRALDEGVNVPETLVAIVASSTASTRQRIQRLGRVLRPAPGKESASVYTIYATDQEERRLLRECVEMDDIAAVKWVRAGMQANG